MGDVCALCRKELSVAFLLRRGARVDVFWREGFGLAGSGLGVGLFAARRVGTERVALGAVGL